MNNRNISPWFRYCFNSMHTQIIFQHFHFRSIKIKTKNFKKSTWRRSFQLLCSVKHRQVEERWETEMRRNDNVILIYDFKVEIVMNILLYWRWDILNFEWLLGLDLTWLREEKWKFTVKFLEFSNLMFA